MNGAREGIAYSIANEKNVFCRRGRVCDSNSRFTCRLNNSNPFLRFNLSPNPVTVFPPISQSHVTLFFLFFLSLACPSLLWIAGCPLLAVWLPKLHRLSEIQPQDLCPTLSPLLLSSRCELTLHFPDTLQLHLQTARPSRRVSPILWSESCSLYSVGWPRVSKPYGILKQRRELSTRSEYIRADKYLKNETGWDFCPRAAWLLTARASAIRGRPRGINDAGEIQFGVGGHKGVTEPGRIYYRGILVPMYSAQPSAN